MKILHTSDWHVGKLMRGQSRADEHRAVLGEIARIAAGEAVDLVLVVGDLFETAAPGPESEAIVYQALLDLAASGAAVAVVSGNHDNPRRLAAVSPLLDLGRVHLVSSPVPPDQGGVWSFAARSGEQARVALLPFVSQRGIVRAEELLEGGVDERSLTYADRVRRVLDALTTGFADDAVNLLGAHLLVDGGRLGGGERSAHTIFDYAVATAAFPAHAHYVALGHLHRAQDLPGPCPLRYCGSPLALDFGEQADAKSVTLVEASPAAPARIREIELTEGRRLRTLDGALDELREQVGTTGEDWLRVRVHEQLSAGLADQVREWFPFAVDVQIARAETESEPGLAGVGSPRLGSSPVDLFASYCADREIDDPRVAALFAELLDDASAALGGADEVER